MKKCLLFKKKKINILLLSLPLNIVAVAEEAVVVLEVVVVSTVLRTLCERSTNGTAVSITLSHHQGFYAISVVSGTEVLLLCKNTSVLSRPNDD